MPQAVVHEFCFQRAGLALPGDWRKWLLSWNHSFCDPVGVASLSQPSDVCCAGVNSRRLHALRVEGKGLSAETEWGTWSQQVFEGKSSVHGGGGKCWRAEPASALPRAGWIWAPETVRSPRDTFSETNSTCPLLQATPPLWACVPSSVLRKEWTGCPQRSPVVQRDYCDFFL